MTGRGIGLAAAGLLLAGLSALAALGELSRPAAALTNCIPPAGEEYLNGAEQQMLAAINAERTSRGLGALQNSPSLSRAAAWKSFDSSAGGAGFSHIDSLGRNPSTRALDCGYPTWVGENIAYGYPGVQATLNAWMNSPGHRANILNGAYRVAGLGVGPNNAWTNDFGVLDDSGGGAPPPPPPPTATPYVPPPTSTPSAPPTSPPYAPPTSPPYVPPTSTPYIPSNSTPSYVAPTSTPYVPGTGSQPTATSTRTRTPTRTPTVRPASTVWQPPASAPVFAAGVEPEPTQAALSPETSALEVEVGQVRTEFTETNFAAYMGLRQAARLVVTGVDSLWRWAIFRIW